MDFVVDVYWDLGETDPSFEDLIAWVNDEALERYRRFPGIAEKHWYLNPLRKRWGAIYLVHDSAALNPDRLPDFGGGRTGPMGRKPDGVEWNMRVASVKGESFLEHWDRQSVASIDFGD